MRILWGWGVLTKSNLSRWNRILNSVHLRFKFIFFSIFLAFRASHSIQKRVQSPSLALLLRFDRFLSSSSPSPWNFGSSYFSFEQKQKQKQRRKVVKPIVQSCDYTEIQKSNLLLDTSSVEAILQSALQKYIKKNKKKTASIIINTSSPQFFLGPFTSY